MKHEVDFTEDNVDSTMKRLVSRQKRESPYNKRLQRNVEERLPRSMSTALEIEQVSAMVIVTRALQEKCSLFSDPVSQMHKGPEH